nr:hypothetical protein CFP56_58607 [Quercus suber]
MAGSMVSWNPARMALRTNALSNLPETIHIISAVSASFHHARYNLDLGLESSTRIKGTTAVEIASGLYWYLKVFG